MRQLTDANDTITLTKSYDPYGNVISSAGSSTSIFGYTNEQVDSYIKLLYLRSRLYSPETGRYLTKDSWQGDYEKPLSLNQWNYVDGNPVNLSDPLGNDPYWCETDKNPSSCYKKYRERGVAGGLTAYLTFDDGPDSSLTPQIALYLHDIERINATFFVMGMDSGVTSAERIFAKVICNLNSSFGNPDVLPMNDWSGKSVLKMLDSLGFKIGNHGWNHDIDWNQQEDGGKANVEQLQKVIDDNVSSANRIKALRAPRNNFPAKPIEGYGAAEGWYYYSYTIAPQENANSPEGIISNLNTSLASKPNNPIILLHSINLNVWSAITKHNLIGDLRSLGYTKFGVLPRPSDSPGYPVIRQ